MNHNAEDLRQHDVDHKYKHYCHQNNVEHACS